MVAATTAPVSVGDLHMSQAQGLVSSGLPRGGGQHTLDVQKVIVFRVVLCDAGRRTQRSQQILGSL